MIRQALEEQWKLPDETEGLRELRLAKEAAEKESIESKPVRRQTGKPRRRTCDAKNPQPLCGTSRRQSTTELVTVTPARDSKSARPQRMRQFNR